MSNPFYPGKRLSYDGQLCTVRYVGPVRGKKGEWLGVEWDDPSRGKHNGERDGVSYFECARKTPTSASFVRPNRPSDKTRSFVEALEQKYASEADMVLVNGNLEKVAKTRAGGEERAIKISGKEVEEVGFDKIRKRLADLQELRIVLLDGMAMRHPVGEQVRKLWNSPALEAELLSGHLAKADPVKLRGSSNDILTECPKIMELDLSRNLFEEWVEVASICEQLNDLHSLRCDGNRFRNVDLSDLEQKYFEFRFKLLRTLSLDDVLLPWENLAGIARLFPKITMFSASCNNIGRLVDAPLPTNLTTVVLEDNDFRSLADVTPLRTLPKLQNLILRNNRISRLGPLVEDSVNDSAFPPSLCNVDLSNNDIWQWSFISALAAAFPGLTSLRISSNPLYESLYSADNAPLTPDDGYMLTIARLANLQILNYSTISPKDRLNAETYYLSQIALSISRLPADVPSHAVIAQHPRYTDLCEEYGEPEIDRKGPVANPNALASRLLTISLKYGERDAAVIEIPKRFSAYTVQGLVGKVLGIQPSKVKLFWETGETYSSRLEQDSAEQPWDSDSDAEDCEDEDTRVQISKKRDVEILPGTRAIATWVDGDEAVLRVEVR